MNEIFISYSRRDADFTQKLFKAFEAANRSVWADWDDIPAASDWSEEIKEELKRLKPCYLCSALNGSNLMNVKKN